MIIFAIAYIGDFDKGDQTGKGVYFQYPYMEYLEYENSDDAQEVINTRDIDIYKGSFKDGKCSGEFKIYHDRYLFYDGDMAKDQMDGKGTIYFEDSKQIRSGMDNSNGGKYINRSPGKYSRE